MTKLEDRRKALLLRKRGMSYGEILNKVHVSKSSLSLWLKDIPLTEEQTGRLKDIHKKAVEKYRQTMKLKRQARLNMYYEEQKKKWLPLSEKELFIAGLFLYWGEGNKSSRNTVGINNTDPSMVKFALYWMTKSLGVSREKIRVHIHLYQDMNINTELKFWSDELGLNTSQFIKPYIKKSKKSDIDQKGFGHGTCGVNAHNTVLKENILMALKAISDNFSEKIKKFDII